MHGKHILLGVTGGIAAYKSPDLVRRLRERGAEVQVVMTAAAREFVTPVTFQAVSGRTVRSDLWDAAAEAAMGHIELARWADAVLIAPASADFLARLASGLADDLLTTLCLATAAPLAVAPAMNHLMWGNAATRHNIATLGERGVQIYGPRAIKPAARPVPGACSSRSSSLRDWSRCSRPRMGRSPAAGCWSLPDRHASASTRCASSAIAAPARWDSPWRRRRTRRVRAWCWWRDL
jgi:phosphopantothenoylcysteine decarboxylase/phosphopantothenate--cysteine ligase